MEVEVVKNPLLLNLFPRGETPGASQDFLLRQGAIVSSVNDTSRLTQLFTTTRGLSFIANQNLLSRGSVKTEATLGPAYAGGTVNQGVYLPTSTLVSNCSRIYRYSFKFIRVRPNFSYSRSC